MEKLTGACIIGQSGGPTAVINASAQGVIQTALKSDCITRVLGAAHGIKGVLEDKLYDMSQEDPAELDLLKLSLIHIWDLATSRPVGVEPPLISNFRPQILSAISAY